MRQVRRIGWVGLSVASAAALAGLVLAAGSALAAGDWDLAPMPWIGFGMTLIVIGLAGGACFGLLLDVVAPIGWWRLLAVPPAILVIGFWVYVLVVGLPTSGGPEFDVATILYTLPLVMAVLVIATIALALPAVLGRRTLGQPARRGTASASLLAGPRISRCAIRALHRVAGAAPRSRTADEPRLRPLRSLAVLFPALCASRAARRLFDPIG